MPKSVALEAKGKRVKTIVDTAVWVSYVFEQHLV